MKKLICFLIIVMLHSIIFSQNCSCEENFKWLKTTFEENDAGFSYVLAEKGENEYKNYNEKFTKKIKLISNNKDCAKTLSDWLSYFRSGHLSLKLIEEKNSVELTSSSEKPSIYNLHNNTLVLVIPSFEYSEKQSIDSLLLANHNKITSTENLIIDLRNNGGGSDESYYELIPFLYTNPIRTIGVELLSTKLNNKRLKDYIDNKSTTKANRIIATNYLQQLKNSLGEFVNLDSKRVHIKTLDTIYTYPKKIGVVINQDNGSTTEQFLLSAKQSKKVKLFGTTTAGVLDISNMYFVNSPCNEFELGYSISRSMRIPDMTIDNKGIPPDYYIDKSIPDKKWIEFVSKILTDN
ncbi:hypothetical protein HSX10_18240 [Winogradskyella undariae]|uniref:S41 family peptidase n=1 Tax=Winogradskyella undariae TaxID=1285465 RepID=UPI00156B460D|nr:S41 family peptidase [Winogradskyella undariae]NRR93516.1 hypothetical protein [Winogradskyella undariae]